MNFSSRPSRLRNEWAPSVPRELLIGVMQIIFGLCRMGMLIRFVSSSVRTGFVNALAVPIFSAQLPHVWSARLRIIALPALTIAMVGLQESVLTAAVIDDMAGTPGTQNHECTGLDLSNMAASVFGGIADPAVSAIRQPGPETGFAVAAHLPAIARPYPLAGAAAAADEPGTGQKKPAAAPPVADRRRPWPSAD